MLRQFWPVVAVVLIIAGANAHAADQPPITLKLPDEVFIGKAAAFAPDGKTVVTVGWKKDGLDKAGIYQWDLATGQCKKIYAGTWSGLSDTWAIRWSPDGQRVGIFLNPDSHAEACWLDAKTWKLVGHIGYDFYYDLSGDKPVNHYLREKGFNPFLNAVMPDQSHVFGLGGDQDGKSGVGLLRWDFQKNKTTLIKFEKPDIRDDYWCPPSISADGKRIAYGIVAIGMEAFVFDTSTGKELCHVKYMLNDPLNVPTHHAFLSRSGQYLLTHVNECPSLLAWRVKDGQRRLKRELNVDSDPQNRIGRVFQVEPTPKTERFVINCWKYNQKSKSNIRVYVVDPEAETITQIADDQKIRKSFLAVSPDEKQVLVPYGEGVRIYPLPAK
ncbi:MAG: hypothetical protein U0798_18690 [Gemmataceae bacterium]